MLPWRRSRRASRHRLLGPGLRDGTRGCHRGSWPDRAKRQVGGGPVQQLQQRPARETSGRGLALAASSASTAPSCPARPRVAASSAWTRRPGATSRPASFDRDADGSL